MDFYRLIKLLLKTNLMFYRHIYYCDLSNFSRNCQGVKAIWNIRCTLKNRKDFKFKKIKIKICTFLSHFSPKYIITCSKRSYLDHLNRLAKIN